MAKGKVRRKREWRYEGIRIGWSAAVIGLLLGLCSSAGALEIQTGKQDMVLRWDTTLKYNYGYRIDSQDPAILKNPNSDDGDRNFDKGTVLNRLDVLSELDFVYKKDYGARVSGAFWYDQRYHDSLNNNSSATSNHLVSGVPTVGLSDVTKRYSEGPNGELLDAFVFGKFDPGEVPVNIKVGRHTVYWGESLLLGGAINGISYAQMPMDLGKAFSVPGTEAKELFRPLNSISFQAQPTEKFSFAAQYFLQWEPYRFPESGSFFSGTDFLLGAGESIITPTGRFLRGNDIKTSGLSNFGLAAHWSPEWLEGTFGAYFRKFSDMLPQAHVEVATGTFHFVYPNNINLYGVSLSKEILNVSVGSEISYRTNMPLVSESVVVLPGHPLPDGGDTYGARGNTWQGVLNFLGIISKTPLWNSASWNTEFTWNRWTHVSQGLQYFKGRDGYTAIDRVTQDFVGGAAGFTPTWFQVLPGMDLSLPLSYSRGLSGNSALSFGGNKNSGTYSVGLSADIYSKYKIDLKYVDFFGDYTVGPTGAVTIYNGGFTNVKDRGTVTLTLKTTI